MIPQHFDSALRELNWSAEDERQTLLVVRIVVIHVEYTGAVITTLTFNRERIVKDTVPFVSGFE